MTEIDEEQLLADLGIALAPVKIGGHTPLEERLIAGFEDILRFHQAHQCAPQHGADRDIFERLYAVRLDRLRKLPEARALLAPLDAPGLLGDTLAAHAGALDEDALLAELGVDVAPARDDIRVLRHVRSHAEIKAAEDIANRTPCEDFGHFEPLFVEAKAGLETGAWFTKPFARDASIEVGDFYIIGGQIAHVADMRAGNVTRDGRENPRLRVIFDNHTEANLLLRSLSRSLYPDGDTPVGRRLLKVDAGPLFAGTAESDDIEVGSIYVLRSRSEHPFVVEHRQLIHKIGVTGGRVEARIAGAENDPTYLLAEVDVVAEYRLHNLNRSKLEGIFHKLFAAARLDIILQDRFGRPVRPKEWFLVPLPAINEAVERILDGSISRYEYDPAKAALGKRA